MAYGPRLATTIYVVFYQQHKAEQAAAVRNRKVKFVEHWSA